MNNNIDLGEWIALEIVHPGNLSPFTAGIHKDRTKYTCITYINSPVSTELAFDINNIKLEWLQCSPLFRFNTSDQITTLCFSDEYMVHTAPVYEEEGYEPYEVNRLPNYENMIEQTIEGKKYLVFGPFLGTDIKSSRRDAQKTVTNTFLKQKYREKINKPKNRETLISIIWDNNDSPSYIKGKFDEFVIEIDKIQKYKIDLVQEKIELTEDNVETIRTTKTLGTFELKGGKNKKKITRKNKAKTNNT